MLYTVRMCRLSRSWLVFLFALLILIAGARALGQTQPVPAHVAILHLQDCAPPCWIGITPGITTLQEAQQRITAVYHRHVDIVGEGEQGSINFSYPDDTTLQFGVQLDYADERQVLHHILIHFGSIYKDRPNAPTLAELCVVLGIPRFVSIPSSYARLRYGSDYYSPTIEVYSTRIDLDKPPVALDFSDGQYFTTLSPLEPWMLSRVPWKGFTLFDKFYNHSG